MVKLWKCSGNIAATLYMIFLPVYKRGGMWRISPSLSVNHAADFFPTLWDTVIADSVGVYNISDCVQEGRNVKSFCLPIYQSCSCILSYTVGYFYCWRCGVCDISDSVQEGRNVKNFSLPICQSCSCVLSYTVGYCYCWQCGVYDISDSVQEGRNVKNFYLPTCQSRSCWSSFLQCESLIVCVW